MHRPGCGFFRFFDFTLCSFLTNFIVIIKVVISCRWKREKWAAQVESFPQPQLRVVKETKKKTFRWDWRRDECEIKSWSADDTHLLAGKTSTSQTSPAHRWSTSKLEVKLMMLLFQLIRLCKVGKCKFIREKRKKVFREWIIYGRLKINWLQLSQQICCSDGGCYRSHIRFLHILLSRWYLVEYFFEAPRLSLTLAWGWRTKAAHKMKKYKK